MADNVVNLHSVNAPEISANDAVFSPETQQAVTHIVAAAEARRDYESASKSANGVLAFVLAVVANLWIHWWVNPEVPSNLIKLRKAANDDAILSERNAA